MLALIVSAFLWLAFSEVILAQENDDCFACHNEELLEFSAEDRAEMVEPSTPPESEIIPEKYLKHIKTFADLSLSLDQKRYANSVHGEFECIICHEDIEDLPHQQHLQVPTACCNCHDEEIAEAVENSVHGKFSEEKYTAGCMGCHDPHYGESKKVWESEFEVKGCLPCHEVCTPELMSHKGKLFPQVTLHLTQIESDISKISCVICHVSGENKDPHKIEPAKFALKDCAACHSSKSILLTEKSGSKKSLVERVTSPDFTNEEIMKGGQYIIGVNRIPLLDTIGLIIFFGTFGLPIVHGGLRFISRKKKVK